MYGITFQTLVPSVEHRERKGLDLAYLNSAAPFEQDVRRKTVHWGDRRA
jgi:hypothetical protein